MEQLAETRLCMFEDGVGLFFLQVFRLNVQHSSISVGRTKTDERRLWLWGVCQVEQLKQDLLNKSGILDRPPRPNTAYLVPSYCISS